MSLEDELSKIRAAAKEDAPLQAAYQDFLSRLDRAETGARALKPGDAIPAFLCPMPRAGSSPPTNSWPVDHW
jgi:hypothetical protein